MASMLSPGIDDDGLLRLLVAKNRAVALQQAHRKNLVNHNRFYTRGMSLACSIPVRRTQFLAPSLLTSEIKAQSFNVSRT